MKTTAEVYHPITDPLPEGLLLNADGTLTTVSGRPYSEHVADRLTLQKPDVAYPVPATLLLRSDAERMRLNTVTMCSLKADVVILERKLASAETVCQTQIDYIHQLEDRLGITRN